MNNMLQKVHKFCTSPSYRFDILANLGAYNHLPDDEFSLRRYQNRTGRVLNLDDPLLFNEKLQWLKIYDRNPKYTVMADKYRVKDYVANRIGSNHVVPTYFAWKDPREIDLDKLPEQFVIKCNHNSGDGMYICKSKSEINYGQMVSKLSKAIKKDYYKTNREWVYKNIPRVVFAEKYLNDSNEKKSHENEVGGLIDYKFYCFHGKPRFLYVGFANIIDNVKHDHLSFLSLEWEKVPFSRADYPQLDEIPSKPRCLENMIQYASQLSQGIPFVRVDFFLVDNNIYFSEFTFTPGAGYGLFSPIEWEKEIGGWIDLPGK